MTLAQPKTRRWTVDEYYRMADLGWFHDRRVELINGRIIQMPAQNHPHVIAVSLAAKALARAFGAGHWVRTQAPMRFTIHDEPEPDLAVVQGDERDYIGQPHPDSALLVVEISDATLLYDQTRKARLYARHGIADYWIVNLPEQRLEIRRRPAGPSRAGGKVQQAQYLDLSILTSGDYATPLAAPNARIEVAELMP